MSGHALILLPWDVGNQLDITLNAARTARRLRLLLSEDPELTKRQFARVLKLDCRDKTFVPISAEPDPALLRKVRARLALEDVGLICSAGTPCFIDPGGWLVRRLRELGLAVTALAGPSILSAMLSLSGLESPREFARGTFAVYVRGGTDFLRAAEREDEPVFLFVNVPELPDCLAAIAPVVGRRLVSAFFDLTKKTAGGRYPYADRVLTMDCAAWAAELESIQWHRVADVALMIHPRGTPYRAVRR